MPRRECDMDKYWGSYYELLQNEPASVDRVALRPGASYRLDREEGDITYHFFSGTGVFESKHPAFPSRSIRARDKQTVPGDVGHLITAETELFVLAVCPGPGDPQNVKIIEVAEKARLSGQFHEHREEHYWVVAGSGYILKGAADLHAGLPVSERHHQLKALHADGGLEPLLERVDVRPGDEVRIAVGEIHCSGSDAPGGLTFVEITPPTFDERDNYRVFDHYDAFRADKGS